MPHQTYEVAIASPDGLEFLSVTACDLGAALADVREAYYADSLDIVSITLKD